MFFLLCSSGCPGTRYPLASGSEVLGFSGMGGNSKGKNVSSTILGEKLRFLSQNLFV